MSCPKDTNVKAYDQFGKLITGTIIKRVSKCKGRKSKYPEFAPVINSLSVESSMVGIYTVVYINGSNFLPPCIGSTFVNFGKFTKLPVIFYSSNNISFVVPINAFIGIYNINVVNIYNNNFSLSDTQSYPGIPNYSNNVSFLIKNIPFCVSGLYNFTNNINFNNEITFHGNGKISFFHILKTRTINYTIIFKNTEDDSDIEINGSITLPATLPENGVKECLYNNNANLISNNSNSKTKFVIRFNN